MADKNKSLLFRLFADNAKDKETILDERVEDSTAKTEETIAHTVVESQPVDEPILTEESPIHYVDEAQQRAQDLINQYMNNTPTPTEAASAKEAAETVETAGADEKKPEAVDSCIKVTIAPGSMEAFVEVWPPVNGGADTNPRLIRAALAEAGVTTGIMDRALFEMALNKPYGKGQILVAQGIPKTDGADGFITENFSRELNLTPFKNADDTVDYKKLNIVREIAVGTVIATVTPPTEGVQGINVKGEPVKCMPGREKKLLRGSNTAISEDGLTLTASANGNLAFVSDRFNVDTTFTVNENVDNNTGNINFCGDVLVKGDVREGYEIRSKGNIKVKGSVEGASLYADGQIEMDGGFNGMKRGTVSSETSIVSKFLQNCTVHAKESIVTEAIINSVVDCDGTITATRGKGTIVGGKVTALHSVEANIIGSDVNTPTAIAVGLSPTVVEEKQTLEKEMRDIEDSQESLRKNLIYLDRCLKMGPLSDKNMLLVESCNKQKILNSIRENKCSRRLAEVNAIIEEAAAGSYVKAKITYPSTKVTIQNMSVVTKTVCNRSLFRKEDGEIKISTY